jgi:peptidoglycan/LPS O-acetylase OafA/YrhL
MHRPNHWPALDGLRALAVLSVMVFHAHAPALPGGFLGVDVFFVISGFLIASQLIQEQQQTGRIRIGFFFARRVAKLQPALWGLLLFDLSLNLLGLNPWYSAHWWQESLAVLWAGANWARAFNWQAHELTGHTWSLGIEEQFYLGWVLGWVALQKMRVSPSRQLALVLIMAMTSALTMAVLYGQGATPSRLYNGTDTRIHAMLLGCALALWRSQRPMAQQMQAIGPAPQVCAASQPLRTKQGLVAGCWGFLLLMILVVSALCIDWRSAAMFYGGYFLLAMVSLGVVALLTGSAPGLLGRVLSSCGLPHLGAVSYGLYLWHYPLYRLALHHAEVVAPGHQATRLICLALATCMTWILAEVSHYCLEKPVRNWVLIKFVKE